MPVFSGRLLAPFLVGPFIAAHSTLHAFLFCGCASAFRFRHARSWPGGARRRFEPGTHCFFAGLRAAGGLGQTAAVAVAGHALWRRPALSGHLGGVACRPGPAPRAALCGTAGRARQWRRRAAGRSSCRRTGVAGAGAAAACAAVGPAARPAPHRPGRRSGAADTVRGRRCHGTTAPAGVDGRFDFSGRSGRRLTQRKRHCCCAPRRAHPSATEHARGQGAGALLPPGNAAGGRTVHRHRRRPAGTNGVCTGA